MVFPPPQLEKSWQNVLASEWSEPYLDQLMSFLKEERQQHTVFPPKEQVFSAFEWTPYSEVQVVIMGQDPYHGSGQAHGLSFSVPPNTALPPSLKNIFKELEADLAIKMAKEGSLIPWARQGVLLLNAVLTVRAGQPQSHAHRGWERFTDAVIRCLIARNDPVIFVLWGKAAQQKCKTLLEEGSQRHFLLTAAHPSPYSATNFFGCRHFSKINNLLQRQGKRSIDWSLS